MFYTAYRRSPPRRRAVRLGVICLAVVTFLDIIRLLNAYRAFSRNLISNTYHHLEDLPRSVQEQKLYISAQFWTSADELRQFWGPTFLELVRFFGPENLYVSILVSGSFDDTADVVRLLDWELEQLNIPRTIVIDPKTHWDEIQSGPVREDGTDKDGWIHTGDSDPPGIKERRRISYLADLRNRGLEPLIAMDRDHGKRYDKILYLNDVKFEISDVLTLLATNDGFYDAACGIDFHLPPAFYDVFAVRDIAGDGLVMTEFPYFRSSKTRNDIMQGKSARVRSCWNGIMVADTAPYYDHMEGGHAKTGLRFRALPDSLALYHVEASECCLVHADLASHGHVHRGVFVNPAVRVGYTLSAYSRTHRHTAAGFVHPLQYIFGAWKNRLRRWRLDGISSSAGQNLVEVHKRLQKWEQDGREKGEKRSEPGEFCAIDEMHVLIWNGWKHA